ncbi:hypothetical protein S7711_04316 [Stachybotrys chartarum IBT 7711]|uniref:ubiquitinyl hydrolase 1 n=1 Tax=Stachybotrys chartarum (strain CBS 109288 / IBT 7711) TaxID=1280523 RepID=A0A084AJD9_STACB|nr:hypothetical protein S7711_04316 [Stachybotrys chartarum IBT 7711]
MGTRYDLRSQVDESPNSYAALPNTTTTGFVPCNMTALKSKIGPHREVQGCHPSRWVYELIHNNFTVCDLFDRARNAVLESHYTWDHPHKLVINGNQSFSSPSQQVLSSVCLDCKYHFVFRIDSDEAHSDSLCNPNHSTWPLPDNVFPWHNLVWVSSESETKQTAQQHKYYPLLATESFVCSAHPCTFELRLEISEPRLSSAHIQLLLDREAICEALARAKERDPAKYEGVTDDWAYEAPLNLNTYVKNQLESTPDKVRSIAKRNKRFAVVFGPRCYSLFRHLEFEELVQEANGLDEGSFTPVSPPPGTGPSGTTVIGTYRSYLEDVRTEIQCLIHKTSPAKERPSFCSNILHEALGCHEVTLLGSTVSALAETDRYKLLGVLPTQTREIIVNAYKRQWDLIPTRRRNLVDSLIAIANDTGDEALSDYAMMQSSVFDSQTQQTGMDDDYDVAADALTFLGLSPPNNYSADATIEAFRRKVVKDPSQVSTARSMLEYLAKASADDVYQARLITAMDFKMTELEALTILGLNVNGLQLGARENEAYDAIGDKLAQSQDDDQRRLYLEALRVVNEAFILSTRLTKYADDARQELGLAADTSNPSAVDFSLPIGLDNIGNTCYLNSLLQYLFTVKPIRDIVLNYDDFKLDLTDESIQARRIGGNKMEMDRGEAVVAQAFVQELAALFKDLQSSESRTSRPSQRLANAVLLSTHTLLHESKQPTERTTTPNPPPLPARTPPSAPPQTQREGEVVHVKVINITDSAETRSNASSQLTLVGSSGSRADDDTPTQDKSVDEMGADENRISSLASKAETNGDVRMEDASDANSDSDLPPLIDVQEGTTDVIILDEPDVPETVDQKVLNALEHQKRSSGTDQQDVEEVIGSILNRLQAAIRPTSVDQETGIQSEKIMETFFVTTINYTRKFDQKEYQHEISYDRCITAFPAAEGECTLYQALDRNFHQQILDDSKLTRYTAIRSLPPVLHVLIQRSQSLGSKNGNPVSIPALLHLDKYMDVSHDSPEFRLKVEDWMLTERADDLKTILANINSEDLDLTQWQEPTAAANPSFMDIEEDELNDTAITEDWDFDGPVEEDFVVVKARENPPAPTEKVTPPVGMQETRERIRQMIKDELKEREMRLDELLTEQTKVAYRLHAVICHSGHLTSGHYWVWIYDFEDEVWRKYNDAAVTVNDDTTDLLNKLSSSGEPYYLCYVRDDDNKLDYVNIPRRQASQPEVMEVDNKQEDLKPASVEDVTMEQAEDSLV